MKRNNIFKSFGTSLLAGALTLSLAACGGSGERSTYEGAEEIIEEEQSEINNPSIQYEDGEYGVVDNEVNYNIDQDYAFEDRELVRSRLLQDIDRIDRELERMETEAGAARENISEETRLRWEETERKLERERERLNLRLQEVDQSTRENWERVRNDVNTTLREWEREWESIDNPDEDNSVDKREQTPLQQ